jgi:DNA uptake protein ComE-like DNA-binding protein|tara:strand:+ start:4392 stop:4766 length:375 start_codon:yes stop_codon:yes gene_type:complete
MAGFGESTAAERSLEKSSRELKALRRIIEKYKDDPKGKKKMLKKMQKYWRSNMSIVQGMDRKPGDYMADLKENLNAVGDIMDPRQEVEESESIHTLKEEDMSAIRDILSKTPRDVAHEESTPDV